MNFIAKRLYTIDTKESKQYKKTKLCTERQQLYNFTKGTGTNCYMLQIFLLEVIVNYIWNLCILLLSSAHLPKCAWHLLSFNKIVLGAWLIKKMNKER